MDNKITNEEVFIVLANNLDFLTLSDGFIEHCKLQFDYGTKITSWCRATRTSFQKIRTVLGTGGLFLRLRSTMHLAFCWTISKHGY